MKQKNCKMIEKICVNAKTASRNSALLDKKTKNKILNTLIQKLKEKKSGIFEENRKDLEAAVKKGLSPSFIQRLKIDEKTVNEMVNGIKTVITLDDPIGEIIEERILKNKLNLKKIRVPLGVVFIIYESRPNVTIDVSAICIKSGNTVILKGGSDALNSNLALYSCIKESLKENNVDENIVQFVNAKAHNVVKKLLKKDKYIDVVIPRGGKSLVKMVVKYSRIPVIKHYEGVCNIYVDKDADFKKAISIIINAKVQKPAVCNAVENLVIHNSIAKDFLPLIKKSLKKEKVEIRGCERTRKIIDANIATDNDFRTEYLAKIISLKIVKDVNIAIDFVNKYGSSHSDAIITENEKAANEFLKNVDSSAIYHNASTRFTDGGCFGMGCEIGISTDKLHARGPMGLKEMTSYKYIIKGNGQVRK